jgi:hypothetical protein
VACSSLTFWHKEFVDETNPFLRLLAGPASSTITMQQEHKRVNSTGRDSSAGRLACPLFGAFSANESLYSKEILVLQFRRQRRIGEILVVNGASKALNRPAAHGNRKAQQKMAGAQDGNRTNRVRH